MQKLGNRCNFFLNLEKACILVYKVVYILYTYVDLTDFKKKLFSKTLDWFSFLYIKK